jgi:hypothetical protein
MQNLNGKLGLYGLSIHTAITFLHTTINTTQLSIMLELLMYNLLSLMAPTITAVYTDKYQQARLIRQYTLETTCPSAGESAYTAMQNTEDFPKPEKVNSMYNLTEALSCQNTIRRLLSTQ